MSMRVVAFSGKSSATLKGVTVSKLSSVTVASVCRHIRAQVPCQARVSSTIKRTSHFSGGELSMGENSTISHERWACKAVNEDGSVAEDAKHVWALDFDGVVCDSCGESAQSAWKAAKELWPDVFREQQEGYADGVAEDRKQAILEDMRTVRPVVETGYENIVQIRCLLEGVDPQDMLERWSTMLPEYMERWQLDRANLVELFGKTRDDWIASDLDGWLAPNRIYPGVPEVIDQLMVEHEVYIVTTKQARFTQMILERMAFIDFPPERIYSQTVSGRPKTEVLEMLQERHPGTQYHFVEDKYSTLVKVEDATPMLDGWNLYLVDWGYNVQKERDAAAASSRINMVDIAQFRSIIDRF